MRSMAVLKNMEEDGFLSGMPSAWNAIIDFVHPDVNQPNRCFRSSLPLSRTYAQPPQ